MERFNSPLGEASKMAAAFGLFGDDSDDDGANEQGSGNASGLPRSGLDASTGGVGSFKSDGLGAVPDSDSFKYDELVEIVVETIRAGGGWIKLPGIKSRCL